MAFQPSPYQTHTPTFDSPLDQLAHEVSNQAGPSGSRGAIVDRAFSLTRGSRTAQRQAEALNVRDANRQQAAAIESKAGLSDRARIQRLREARLSQQQDVLAAQTAHASSTHDGQRPAHGFAGGAQQPTVTSAFRDSVASDISFNTITGSQDRTSMMMDGLMNANQTAAGSSVDNEIARELQGLALRRRPSLDTVRSSEFGEEGRWARAWAGSDDEDEEDEIDLQAMRAQNLSAFDLEGSASQKGQTAGLGALAKLGNLSGARAAMQQEQSWAKKHESFQLPELKSAVGAEHSVRVTSAQNGRAQRSAIEAQPSYQRELLPHAHQVHRRDTMISIAGEVGEVTQNTVGESPASVSSSPDSSIVKIWPPTPASSRRRKDDILDRDAARNQMNANSRIATVRQSEDEMHNRHKALPISPSAAMIQTTATWPKEDHEKVARIYSDPNRGSPGFAADGLGKARRRAIAQHGGRESLVSDLDVVTLRLDGTSTVTGENMSRRDSSSTIGTVSSEVLDELRKRRSEMEYANALTSGLALDKRSSTSTIRNVPMAEHAQMSSQYRHHVSPPVPKRSNTLPEEQQQNSINAQLSPAPWATQPSKALRNSTGTDGRPSPASSLQPQSPTMTQPAKSQRSPSNASAPTQSQAEKFLTLGISHHESGDLSRSAYYFERSAKVEGGCVVGMCMWGMALREGWGVRKDQKRGFEWISRAASRAGDMMAGPKGAPVQQQKTETELKAIRSELKLSVYELGKCFCYGWGVKMDKQMALEYFELAAKLGDADAQAEAGALLAAGKGCKKDLKKAAMYYRMAEVQGYDTVGLSWIHKDKYDPDKTPMATATTKRGR